ncbi:S8 family serine peptidase [Clostridioides difficile]|uniref:S8 family serine peptidase n=12 Tax=Clostridioides difficile TaxID=1496 RepID=A0A9P3YTI3_CLODI|nr:S8 family serine peptidase [Clostridioides difficile]AWH76407.1 hypothetical protein DDG61_04205 [Clostridioides difficile]AWH80183.1 hypothetical protein DDG63_03990 [Clostridioides difficile]AXU45273.1 serine protease [Clostridioides difficile]AXU48977.1 serine protease [Clostridioides difficile]AXU63403.1 serine protease [Clostridioides difficile]
MEKIKVAVVDTGIDVNDDSIKKYIKFNKNIQLEEVVEYKDLDDTHGHGTLCSKTILSVCRNTDRIEIYPIKIFNQGGCTSGERLLEALERNLDSDIDLINISASTLNDKYKRELKYICEELCKKGKIIISSHHKRAKDCDSFPTVFNSVIGVTGSNDIYNDNDYIYEKGKKIQIIANTKECFVEFRNEVTHFGKSSRASAVITGTICNIFNKYGKIMFDELEKIFEKESLDKNINTVKSKFRNKQNNFDLCITKNQKLDISRRIVNMINKKFAVHKIDLDFLDKYSIFNNFTDLGNHNAFKFLTEINKEFEIEISYKGLFLYELENLNDLVNLVCKHLNKASVNNSI